MSIGVVSSHAVAAGAGGGAFATAVLADSPLAYWKLDETAGSVAADASGNAHDGSYGGFNTLGVASLLTDGSGKALRLTSNTSNGVSVTSAAWMNVSALTIEALVNFSSATDASNGDAIVSRYGAGGFQWLIWRNTAGKLAMQINTSISGFVNVVGTTSPTLGTRYVVGATWDGSLAKLWVNGVQEGSSTSVTGTLAASTQALAIGAYSNATNTVPGADIDEVSFYGTALSGARMAAHAAAA